ncbi:PREDICTED: adenosine kinase [Ceratosolen solmsi marchali]|uniref:Adenosine kinase n=1 Tax=Ceratosolen solmsi marchali TaxID=326594 RepID=A0AAJ6YNV9_9HYME|nr:PREDICTED: adenosine kinase [Ceratosolen solmsi marchali]
MSMKEIVANFKHPVAMAFGNPLLDVIISNDDNNLVSKYNLTLDAQIELKEKDINQLCAELTDESKIITRAGGSAQNTMRILQKLCGDLNSSKMCVYYGGLGDDSRGKTLEKLVQAANIDARYVIHSTLPTGICVSIIKGAYRTLAANIGAASIFTLEDLKHLELPFNSVKVIYIEGFFITHSLDVAKEVVKKAQERNIVTAFNLSATYIFKDHHAALCEMVGIAKIVFGNAKEMIALANSLNLEFENVTDIPFLLNNLKSVTISASNSLSSDWLSNDSIFVMTQGGADPAIIVWGQGCSAQVSPVKPRSPIIDTTGAGDSLVAGFLAGMITGRDPKTCLEWGCKVASDVITNLGVTLSDDLPFDFLEC